MKKAIFLDRDGTITADKGFVHKKEDLELLAGAAEAIKLANRHGFLVVVVTNQSGVARGLFTEEEVKTFNAQLAQILAEQEARIDAFYYCPHHPQALLSTYRKVCDCRKPAPGLVLKAAREMGIDLSRSWTVGDNPRDVEAGRLAGCSTILLGKDVKNLLEAIQMIVSGFANPHPHR
jgi:D-glycero-D-manno-heptose 1,7-bisphosphate phosphatase